MKKVIIVAVLGVLAVGIYFVGSSLSNKKRGWWTDKITES